MGAWGGPRRGDPGRQEEGHAEGTGANGGSGSAAEKRADGREDRAEGTQAGGGEGRAERTRRGLAGGRRRTAHVLSQSLGADQAPPGTRACPRGAVVRWPRPSSVAGAHAERSRLSLLRRWEPTWEERLSRPPSEGLRAPQWPPELADLTEPPWKMWPRGEAAVT